MKFKNIYLIFRARRANGISEHLASTTLTRNILLFLIYAAFFFTHEIDKKNFFSQLYHSHKFLLWWKKNLWQVINYFSITIGQIFYDIMKISNSRLFSYKMGQNTCKIFNNFKKVLSRVTTHGRTMVIRVIGK